MRSCLVISRHRVIISHVNTACNQLTLVITINSNIHPVLNQLSQVSVFIGRILWGAIQTWNMFEGVVGSLLNSRGDRYKLRLRTWLIVQFNNRFRLVWIRWLLFHELRINSLASFEFKHSFWWWLNCWKIIMQAII